MRETDTRYQSNNRKASEHKKGAILAIAKLYHTVCLPGG